MGWGILPAAMLVAGLTVFAIGVRAEDSNVSTPVPGDATLFETSARMRMGWTEIAQRGNRPKAWDATLGNEWRASLRVLSGIFEGKLEIGALSDRFATFVASDSNSLRADAQFGLSTKTWSALVEWKGRNVFSADDGDFVAGFNSYDLRVKYRFTDALFAGLPAVLFQVSATGGYSASTPRLFARDFADCEFEMVQVLGDGFAILVAPKLEVSRYLDFAGTDRRDAVLSVRVSPSYNFGDGITLSIEGQATAAISSLESKTGETWAVTPILKLQRAL